MKDYKGYFFKKINCNVCGKDDTVYLGRREPLAFNLPEELKADIVKCRNCGLIYPNPMPLPDMEKLQENYSDPEKYFPVSVNERRLRFYREILKGVSKYVYRGRLLDVGCGRGELLSVAKSLGWNASGVEISESFASYARECFGLDVKTGDIKSLDYTGAEFDVVTLVSVLQHAADPKALLLNINKLLKNKSLLFIETMNNGSLIYRMGDFYYKIKGSNKTTHLSPTFPSYQIYGFTRKSIKMILEATGFRIVKIYTKGGISRTESRASGNMGDAVLRFIRKMIMAAAGFFNGGQVLVIYAIKEENK